MKSLLAILLIGLTLGSPAMAFDSATQTIIDGQKTGKPVAITDIATLMQTSARWCYKEEAGSCAWTDIYLEVTQEGAEFEVSNSWNADIDITLIDFGRFKDGRFICETGNNWLPTVRAVRRADGTMVNGRALHALKAEIAPVIEADQQDCFSYQYRGADGAAETVTLLQKQWRDGVHDPERDALVTLYFNDGDADALTLRW